MEKGYISWTAQIEPLGASSFLWFLIYSIWKYRVKWRYRELRLLPMALHKVLHLSNILFRTKKDPITRNTAVTSTVIHLSSLHLWVPATVWTYGAITSLFFNAKRTGISAQINDNNILRSQHTHSLGHMAEVLICSLHFEAGSMTQSS